MAIQLRRDLVRSLIERRFTSLVDFVVAWEERVASGAQKTGRARDRSTIYRWLERGLPSNKNDIFGFAAVLDVDPVALLDIDEQFIREHYGRERRLFQLRHRERAALSPFWPIYTPGPEWPDQEIAHTFFARPWVTRDFAHDASRVEHAYAAVWMRIRASDNFEAPRSYHFAYQRASTPDGMWRPYGSVIGYAGEVCLFAENGNFERAADKRSPEIVVAETYFGSGPANFRIASLHEFEITVQAPSKGDALVRFEA